VAVKPAQVREVIRLFNAVNVAVGFPEVRLKQ